MTTYPYLALICIAIGFSWSGFASIFTASAGTSQRDFAHTTIAVSIFLCATGYCFINNSLATALVVVACGMMIACLAGRRMAPTWSLVIAAGSFAAYLPAASS